MIVRRAKQVRPEKSDRRKERMNSKTRNMTVCAIMAALMCILGPMSVPIGPIPISLTNLVIYLTVYLLGTKKACISYLVYMLLGAVGLPVFSGFAGGIGKLAGPTGGYLVGFIFMTIICGVIMERVQRKAIPTWLGMVLGTLVAYLFGTVWFVVQTQSAIMYALTACVFPFIPFDLIKITIAILLGKAVRKRLPFE